MTTAVEAEKAPSSEAQFIRGIGPLAAVSMVVGAMIGSGIFIVSADIARQTSAWGPGGLMLVWLLTGAMTVTGALMYAELAAMMPRAGGQYVFLREGLSPSVGFLYGWTLFTVIQTGTIAAVAVAFARFLGVLVPSVTADVFLSLGHVAMPGGEIELGLSNQRLVALGMVLLLTFVNMRGVRLGAGIQTVFTVAKVGALIALILLGLTVFRQPEIAAANFGSFWGTGSWGLAMLPAVGAAMVGSLFSSDAWNNVTFTAAEVRDPARNLPRALALGTILVSSLYLLANLAYLSVLPYGGSPEGTTVLERGLMYAAEDRVGTAALAVMLGSAGAAVMAVLILISTFGCNNGLILAGPRVFYAMARDGLFFRRAAHLHSAWRTPTFGLGAQAAWAMVLCLSGTYGQLLDYVIIAAVLFYFLTIVALFRLRATRPDLPRPVRAVGYPVVPALYALGLLGIMIVLLVEKPEYTQAGLLIVALGIPVYAVWRKLGTPVRGEDRSA
ncbi:MAG TPA: amino acid permease [Gemmatimonadales bacterium]|nr:amino acid permease [Gemmatimonadales bacterium]